MFCARLRKQIRHGDTVHLSPPLSIISCKSSRLYYGLRLSISLTVSYVDSLCFFPITCFLSHFIGPRWLLGKFLKKSSDQPDFSESLLFSDVVFVVEDKKFHVHRYILAQWSPVFKTMFLSGFKEKNLSEIPLPGKKASEFKELLLLIYSSVSGEALNTINDTNCQSLLRLAREYQIEAIYKKCEERIVKRIRNAPGNTFMADMIFAQTCNFEKLLKISVEKAINHLRLDDIKRHEMFNQIEPQIYKQILEGIIQRLEEPVTCGHCGFRVTVRRKEHPSYY